MNKPRKDIHRPAEIIPSDYDYLFSFSYPGMGGDPAINVALLNAARTGKTQKEPVYGVSNSGMLVIMGYRDVNSPWGKLPFFEKTTGSESGCDVCGAHYRHGDAWLHRPTGEVILIGHICAGKMDLHCDRGDWTRRQKELAQLRKTAEYKKAKAERIEKCKASAVEVLDQNEGLREALETDHYIVHDIKDKLWHYGDLSPKQIELVFKIANQESDPDKPRKIDPPTGRVKVSGKVISLKDSETDFGWQLKMLVEVTEDHGSYRVFGTVPSAISEDIERGSMVSFMAAVRPREPGFGFFSRPTQATIQ